MVCCRHTTEERVGPPLASTVLIASLDEAHVCAGGFYVFDGICGFTPPGVKSGGT